MAAKLQAVRINVDAREGFLRIYVGVMAGGGGGKLRQGVSCDNHNPGKVRMRYVAITNVEARSAKEGIHLSGVLHTVPSRPVPCEMASS